MEMTLMKQFNTSALVLLFILGASPAFARIDCRSDVREFDAAVKTTKASHAEVLRAVKLRDEANNDCAERGGSAKGDADMQRALKLIRTK